jgi:hypothetical protein
MALRRRYTGKDAELAVGGTPATVAIRSQMIPLRIENNAYGLRARKAGTCRPYLFPKEAYKTKSGTAVSEHAKQSNEHSDK